MSKEEKQIWEVTMILVFPIAFLAIFYYFHKKEQDFAATLAKSLLLFEGFVLLGTNLLSIGSMLRGWTIFLFWLLVTMLVTFLGYRRDGKAYFKLSDIAAQPKKQRQSAQQTGRLSVSEIIMLCLGAVLILVLLYGALFTVPYNYDSMTYHLARIAHWIDNGNVNYYITNIDRQLYSPVLSEYNMLHMMLLCGNDMLLNLQQFLGMLITAYYVYRLVLMLGTRRETAIFGSFVFLTMPLTITQSITTQNDLTTAMWFVIFLYYLLGFIQAEHISFQPGERKKAIEQLICIGASVGFAFLMKVSVCASMLFFMPWLLLVCIRRKDKLTDLIRAAAVALTSMLLVISETLLRTYMACGSFVNDATSGDIMVATKNVSYILVNILKNFSLLITQHLWTWLNGFVYRIAISAGAALQVEVNHVAIAFHGFDFITYLNTGDDMYSHDRTSSAFAAYFALLAGVLLVIAGLVQFVKWVRERRKARTAIKAAERSQTSETDSREKAAVSFGFVISAWLGFGFIMALLRWQPWGSRLMYPALAVTVIAGAHMLGWACQRLRYKGLVLLPLALLSAVLCLKPLDYNLAQANKYVRNGCQNRMEYYFENNKRYDSYEQLKDKAKEIGAQDIAVVISGDGYDYPLWKLFREEYPQAQLRHILVDDTRMITQDSTLSGVNITGENARTGENPDCILWIERGLLAPGDTLDYHGETYTCIFVADSEKAPDSLLVRIKAEQQSFQKAQ